MNEQERAEFSRLKEQQAKLEKEMQVLSSQLRLLEQRLNQPEQEETRSTISTTPVAARLGELSPQAINPEVQGNATPRPSVQPPPVPPVISASTKTVAPPEPARNVAQDANRPLRDFSVGAPPPSPGVEVRQPLTLSEPPIGKAPEPAEAKSFEMRLGTFWLVRIGIVMVLTGLVFFGNLAYQNYISQLGPGGKVSLLYFASALLLCGGLWWQRKAATETLKNYARVLFGGGLAAVYFTTYAAHHFEPLRIIQSPFVDGVLLLICAGFMIWISDRRKSEVMALFSLGLAYYTSIITRVGSFTLYSNLVLTAAAVFFLVRNRWAMLSFGSLVASYAAYGFWRFYDGSGWRWASPEEGLWLGTYFLISYWVLFTAAVFLSRDERLAGQNRAGFITVNNGAFFTF
ncbi:MAG TPA: DUF2339 domain-containing protein, partial [Clostridia bacterium]|nr:DUF2339 domain-containing protein [Clostridia bacterium]